MVHYKTKNIKLSNLEVNWENPRFEAASNQRQAIERMIEDQNQKGKNKLFKLAEHMINNGLNPSDLPIVTPSNSNKRNYVLLEGNRRIIALKLLETPSIVESVSKPLYKKIKKLSKDFDNERFNRISCIVFNSLEDAKVWIEIKHTGQNDGVGTVGWDYQQQQRFQGNKSTIQIIDFVKNSEAFSDEIKENVNTIKSSSLERLMSDPDVRDFLGLNKTNGKLECSLPKEEFEKPLKKIIKDMSDPNFTVKEIYYKQDRHNYLSKFHKAYQPDKDKSIEPWELSSPPATLKNTSVKPKKKKVKPNPIERKTLVPNDCKLNIPVARINSIYHELSRIEINKFHNAVGVLFRVFIELSVDYYIQEKQIIIRENDRIKEKVKKIANSFETRGLLTEDELFPARQFANNDENYLSVNTFHAYIHRMRYTPSSSDLKTKWTDLQLFIETLWDLK